MASQVIPIEKRGRVNVEDNNRALDAPTVVSRPSNTLRIYQSNDENKENIPMSAFEVRYQSNVDENKLKMKAIGATGDANAGQSATITITYRTPKRARQQKPRCILADISQTDHSATKTSTKDNVQKKRGLIARKAARKVVPVPTSAHVFVGATSSQSRLRIR